MSDADKYLARLDGLSGKKKNGVSSEFRESYKRKTTRGRGEIYGHARDLAWGDTIHLYRNRQDRQMSDTDLRALARRTMELAKEDAYVGPALDAAEIYAGLGKPHIGITKLMAVVEKASKEGKISEGEYTRVRHFIERHAGKKQKSGGLEGKLPVFILFLFSGLVLGISSLTTTGNAISNLTGTSQGLLGVFLFIAGLLGLFFSIK